MGVYRICNHVFLRERDECCVQFDFFYVSSPANIMRLQSFVLLGQIYENGHK